MLINWEAAVLLGQRDGRLPEFEGMILEKGHLIGGRTIGKMGVDLLTHSYFLVAVGITATIVQGGLIGRLTKRFGERAICRSGLALMVVAMVLVPPLVGSQSMPLLLLGGVLLAGAMGLWGPATTGLLSISVDADEQGGVLGINQSLSALGRVLGPLAAGALFQTQITLPFYVGAGFFLVASLVAMSLRPVR